MRSRTYTFLVAAFFLALPIGTSAIALTAPAEMKALVGVLGFLLSMTTALGFYKYLIEPHWIAFDMRQKFATALWIACLELEQQLNEITLEVHQKGDAEFRDALLKIPNDDNDQGKMDWFTKIGYYTSITAYKIALVSAWLSIYRQSLLLSPVSESREFLSDLYVRADAVARAFSEGTILWRDYFYAIGDKLIEPGQEIPRPISFAGYCDKASASVEFRLFFEQVHMYLWFVSDKRKNLTNVSDALKDLRKALNSRNLVDGLTVSELATSLSTFNLYKDKVPAKAAGQ